MFKPVLLQNQGRNGGKERAHKAVERPPVVLQDEAGENDEATQRVVNKHHLSGSTQNPVQQLQQEKLFWREQTERVGHFQMHTVGLMNTLYPGSCRGLGHTIKCLSCLSHHCLCIDIILHMQGGVTQDVNIMWGSVGVQYCEQLYNYVISSIPLLYCLCVYIEKI